jgi:hypothetical protein
MAHPGMSYKPGNARTVPSDERFLLQYLIESIFLQIYEPFRVFFRSRSPILLLAISKMMQRSILKRFNFAAFFCLDVA